VASHCRGYRVISARERGSSPFERSPDRLSGSLRAGSFAL